MISLYLFVALDIKSEQTVSLKGKDPECILTNKSRNDLAWWMLCSISALAVDLAAIQQPPRPAFYVLFLFLLLFGCKLILLRIYLSPHVYISSYCIKKNTGESKQASIFPQVTRRRNHTQISKKRKGVGLENGGQIYLRVKKNPPNFLGSSQILDCGYFSQLLVIPGTANQGRFWSNWSCHPTESCCHSISLTISDCNNKENNSTLRTVSTVSLGDRFALVYKYPKGKLRRCKLKK